MGADTFFSKIAGDDILAGKLGLPGANKYQQYEVSQQQQKAAQTPYMGVTPTLAAANQGYVPGGVGSIASDYVRAAGAAGQPGTGVFTGGGSTSGWTNPMKNNPF